MTETEKTLKRIEALLIRLVDKPLWLQNPSLRLLYASYEQGR